MDNSVIRDLKQELIKAVGDEKKISQYLKNQEKTLSGVIFSFILVNNIFCHTIIK